MWGAKKLSISKKYGLCKTDCTNDSENIKWHLEVPMNLMVNKAKKKNLRQTTGNA